MVNRGVLLVAVLIAGLGAGAFFLYRVARPSHAKAALDDPALTLEYPVSWKSSGFSKEKDLRILILEPEGDPPFDTFWDAEEVLLRVVEFPPGRVSDLEKRLMQIAADARADNPRVIPAFHRIETLAMRDGVGALTMTLPSEHEVLDVGLPKEGFWPALYRSLLVRDPAWTYVVFQGKGGKSYEASYLLPGDRLARIRYRPLFKSILESLHLK